MRQLSDDEDQGPWKGKLIRSWWSSIRSSNRWKRKKPGPWKELWAHQNTGEGWDGMRRDPASGRIRSSGRTSIDGKHGSCSMEWSTSSVSSVQIGRT